MSDRLYNVSAAGVALGSVKCELCGRVVSSTFMAMMSHGRKHEREGTVKRVYLPGTPPHYEIVEVNT